jgi:hypothetical protein
MSSGSGLTPDFKGEKFMALLALNVERKMSY